MPGADAISAWQTSDKRMVDAVQQAAVDHLNAEDAETALSYYAEDAAIVSNGYLYSSFQEFAEHVREFYASLRKVDTAIWEDIDIRVINPETAIFNATFRWRSTDNWGETMNLQGVWTAVYVRDEDRWKIKMRHESFTL